MAFWYKKLSRIRNQFNSRYTELSQKCGGLGLCVHLGKCLEEARSVWLSAVVLVDVQLFDLLLQEGNGHRAATGSMWQRVHLESTKHRKHMQGFHNVQGSHFWHMLDLVYPSKVSPFFQGTRGHGSCGGFSCPFFQVSTLQGLSGWRDLTVRSQPRYFSTRRFPCYFLSRYFGRKRMSHPLNL